MNNHRLCKFNLIINCFFNYLHFLLFIVHYVVRTFNKGELDNEMVKRFMAYNFEEHIRTHPGQRIVILFDMTDTGLRHLVSFLFIEKQNIRILLKLFLH